MGIACVDHRCGLRSVEGLEAVIKVKQLKRAGNNDSNQFLYPFFQLHQSNCFPVCILLKAKAHLFETANSTGGNTSRGIALA